MNCDPDVPGLVYVQNFVQDDESRGLLEFINAQPWNKSLKRWTQHYGYEYVYNSSEIVEAEPIPEPFRVLIRRFNQIAELGDYTFDQVIVNRYLPGEGISAHVDHRTNFGDKIVSVSLGGACTMTFTHTRDQNQVQKKLLQPGSLLVLTGAARYDYTHAIPARKSDEIVKDGKARRVKRDVRTSLTFRQVRL